MVTKKQVIKISLATVLILGSIAAAGIFVMFNQISSAKSYCSAYSDAVAEKAEFPDRQKAGSYDQCLKDKGFGGF